MFAITLDVFATQETNWIILKLCFTKSFPPFRPFYIYKHGICFICVTQHRLIKNHPTITTSNTCATVLLSYYCCCWCCWIQMCTVISMTCWHKHSQFIRCMLGVLFFQLIAVMPGNNNVPNPQNNNNNTFHSGQNTCSSSSENFCNSINSELTATVRQRQRWKSNARRKIMLKMQIRRSK